jgi:hypothetical protein
MEQLMLVQDLLQMKLELMVLILIKDLQRVLEM